MDEHVYEVRIWVGDQTVATTMSHSVEHRFPTLPEPETLVALKDEAVAVWRLLYPDMGDPGSILTRVEHLMAPERNAAREAAVAAHGGPAE